MNTIHYIFFLINQISIICYLNIIVDNILFDPLTQLIS